MSDKVKPIPEGYHAITPALVVSDAAAALEFYKRAFGAEEVMRMASPDGKIMHAEIKIGDSTVWVYDEFPGSGSTAPTKLGSVTGSLNLYCVDTDAAFKQAIEAGATARMEPMDAFWGDRFSQVADPFGQLWSIMTHVKDLTLEEVQKAGEEFFKNMAGGASA